MDRVLSDFIFFFTIIDPIGTVPVFLAVTAGLPVAVKRRIAIRAAVFSAAILVAFIVIGQFLLSVLEIDFAAFQVAGSVILFLFALDMIFGTSKPDSEIAEAEQHADEALDTAVYPLTIPSIAGPGSIMAAIVRTDNDRYTLAEQAGTTAVVVSILAIVLLAMLAASRIEKLIGSAGASMISRVMGLILAAVAADGALGGIQTYFA